MLELQELRGAVYVSILLGSMLGPGVQYECSERKRKEGGGGLLDSGTFPPRSGDHILHGGKNKDSSRYVACTVETLERINIVSSPTKPSETTNSPNQTKRSFGSWLVLLYEPSLPSLIRRLAYENSILITLATIWIHWT
jgi:hypothetical protein